MPTTKEIPMSEWIDRMASVIIGRFDPLRLILFGSHARGDAGPDSDVDFLVVLPGAPEKRKAAVAIRRSLSGFPIAKDVIVTTPEEIAQQGDLIGSILEPALREGKVLYER
jgi:predicted nucleotidyltransferase